MSRSKKKLPIVGIAICDSEKKDKQTANRKLRTAVRVAIAEGNEVMPELRKVSDVWTFGKDGKNYVTKRPVEARRK